MTNDSNKLVPSVYLVLGEESKDADDKIMSIQEALSLPKADVRFGFDADDVARTISDIETPSIFGDKLFLVMENSEQLTERNSALLAKCLRANRFDGAIVFRSEKNKLSSHLENIVPKDNKFIYYLMFENRKPQYVRSVFRKFGYSADSDAISALLELVDNDKSSIERSCKRVIDSVSLLSADRKSISQADILDCLDFDRDEDSIELFSHIAGRRLKPSIASAEKAARSNKNISLVVLSLLGYVRRALSYKKNLMDRVSNPWKISTIAGEVVIKYPAEKDFLQTFASNYSMEASLCMQYILLDLERATRSGMDFETQMIRLAKDLTRIVRL